MESPVGLVLSGGSLTAIAAHCGVLSALDELKIMPSAIVANSGGAITGGLYASGVNIMYLLKLINSLKRKDVIKISLTKFFKYISIISSKKLRRILEVNIDNKEFGKLKIPFACVAVNLTRGKKEVLKAGCSVVDAILASAAIPFLFEPIKIGSDFFCDGGGVSNTPIAEAVETFPDIDTWLVASLFDYDPRDNVFPEKEVFRGNIFTKAFNIFQQYIKAGARELAELQAEKIENKKVINIDLRGVKRIDLWDFKKVMIPFQQAQGIVLGMFK